MGVLAAQASIDLEEQARVLLIIAEKRTRWALLHDAREQNTKACIAFMVYFDSENIVNTEELLILKAVIFEIERITCRQTDYPTQFPTAFPTAAPSVTDQPTAFPTRAPTAVPTRAPTADPTTSNACAGGDWMFMRKVFATPERFAVPAYADGVTYTIATTAGNTCRTIETSHTNIEGATQTISHQYKCCGDSGSFYGAISTGSNATAATELCGSSTANHCGLFGANMFLAATIDPSIAGVTTGQTTAPTVNPTSFPTRAPTVSPTAYPTREPTPFPTTRAPTMAPTAQPTKEPTAYPTRQPTGVPTEPLVAVNNGDA
jgi:hypothetical protein